MKRILTAVVLIPLVLLVVFKAPLWLFTAVCGLFAVLAASEYLSLAKNHDPNVARWPGTLLVAFLFATLALSLQIVGGDWLVGVIFCLPFIYPFFLLAMGLRLSEPKSALLSASLGSLVLPYIVFPLAALIGIRELRHGWFYLLWLFAMVWSGDIFAYYVGKNFGKRLLAPRISPKKTWEGTIASVLGAALVSVLLVYFAPRISSSLGSLHLLPGREVTPSFLPVEGDHLLVAAAIAILINILAQIGDLVESVIKRGAGVKDSGSLLPGHGGILDRIDALLFAAPAALLLFSLIRWVPPSATRYID
jgi:phosphatidate cytidylyltransferase